MELEIVIAPAAREDIDDAARYLAQRNPEASIKLLHQIDHTMELVRARPFMEAGSGNGKVCRHA